MAKRTVISEQSVPDPDVQSSEIDIREHERTYSGFVHLVKWTIVHLVFDLVGLYFIIVGGNALFGLALIAIGTVVVVWGALSTPKAAKEAPRVEARTA